MRLRLLVLGSLVLICSVGSGCSTVRLKKLGSLPDYAMSVTTEDGWSLALFRRKPQERGAHGTPVVLVPSVGMNRLSFTSKGSDLAGYLSLQGFDVWLLDVRGSVSSKPPSRANSTKSTWVLSDVVDEDLPAAVDAIERETGRRGVAWIGHGLGAHLGARFAAANPGRVTSLVGLGLTGSCNHPTRLQRRLGREVGLAPSRRVPLRSMGRLLSKTLHLAPDTRILHSLFNEANVSTEAVAELASGGLEDIRTPVLRELEAWCGVEGAADTFFSADFSGATAPALFLAGRVDSLAPAWGVQAAWESWGTQQKKLVVLGQGWGQAHDYGHLDLVLGDGVRDEVFPLILDWLLAERPTGGASEGDGPSPRGGGASEAATTP